MILRIGTRGSRLARWQADFVRERLIEAFPDLHVDVIVIQTTGDRITDVPLAKIGDKGLFTKELDRALLANEIDLAVHSLKDVPTMLPEGLALGAVLEREDPRDVLLPAAGAPSTLAELPAGARIGTSSLRRRAQIRHLRPDLTVLDLRGNLDTRMERLRAGHFDAIVLARAGVRRLGWEDAVGDVLGPPDWLPAVGQGALGVAVRADDEATRTIVASLEHEDTRIATTAERAFLRALEGGCQIPIGALATREGDRIRLHGLVADLDGDPLFRGEASGDVRDAEAVGRSLAEDLLNRGADAVLRRIRDLGPGHLPGASVHRDDHDAPGTEDSHS